MERLQVTQNDSAEGKVRTLGPIVSWLTELGAATDAWFVSCYLKLEPRDRTRGKYLIKLKNRIRERLDWLDQRGVPRATREGIERDLNKIRQYLEHPGNLPTGRGVALFAADSLDLFEPVPLPRVFRSRLAIDRSPLVRELAALDDEFGLVLCAVYDRTSARFFKVSAFDVAELPGLPAGDTTRAGRFHGTRSVPGRGESLAVAGEHNYNQRIQGEKQRHYAHVAQRLFDLSRGASIRGIVLAGTGTDAEIVRPHLHPYLEKQVLGATRLNPKSAAANQVMEAVLGVRQNTERLWEAEHVQALAEGLGTGWAVNGLEPSLRALARGQVRTLLVDPTATRSGYRCAQSGRLTSIDGGCKAEGEPEAVPDLVDEAIEETLRQAGHVEVVEDHEARGEVDNLAALLRFKQR
jgi:peptide chain release factor subunit 1